MLNTQTFRPPDPFVTEGSAALDATVAYRTWGRLDSAAGNAVVVCHALTGDADAASWWPGLVGPGRLADPEKHFVVCANALGSCYGTTGPGTLDARGRRLGSRFPPSTVRDQARLHAALLRHLGVRSVALAAGGSMGGMQALELALVGALSEADAPPVRRLLLVGMGAAHGAWQVGISEAQRLAIQADARWRGGDFPPDDPPVAGLAAARAHAMMTYRSSALFAERFGRARQEHALSAPSLRSESEKLSPLLRGTVRPPVERSDGRTDGGSAQGADGRRQPDETPGGPFAVESYLRYQGAKLAGRFDAGAYVALTRAMDAHDIDRDRPPGALAALDADALCVGISSDVLYPPAESRRLAARLPRGRYAELDSPFGHDAFLVDFEGLDRLARPFLTDTGFFAPTHADLR